MAEPSHSTSALKKLEDQLTCPVCLSHYTDPRVLQCIHTFCRHCLESLAKRERASETDEEASVVECPVCRRETAVGSIDGLQKAFHIQGLFDIKRDLERSSVREQTHVLCEAHRMEVKFYCKDCSELLCNGCTLGKHKLHSFDDVSLAAKEEVEEMETKLSTLESNISQIEEGVAEMERGCQRAGTEEREIQETVRKSCDKARQLIDERERSLIKELHEMTKQKVSNLAVRKEQLKLVGTQLVCCRKAVKEGLQKKTTAADSLMLNKTLVSMVEDASRVFQDVACSVTVTPAAKDIAFFADESVLEPLSEYGNVYVKLPHPDHCLVEGEGLSWAKVGEVSEIQLSLYNQHSLEIDVDLAAHTVSSELYSSADEPNLVKCSIEKRGKNRCMVKYVPAVKGPHKLDIEVLGCPVQGSPFLVSVRGPHRMIGPTPHLAIGDLPLPWGVSVDKSGRLCVAVSGRKEVVVVDGRSGARISTAVKRGLLVSTLEEPTGVAFDRDGNTIVADLRLCTINRVSPDGHVLQSVGSSGNKPLEFSYPAAVAVHPLTGRIYVAEWQENNRVQILNHDFSFYKVFGTSGSGPGEFQCPSGIAFDTEGHVYVADCNNARIQVFTGEGDYVREFGKRGKKEGKLGLPMGLCMDHTSDVLYVTDVLNHRVSVFTTQGQFGRCFGHHGTGPGQFNKPQGIAVDEFRFVYVSDTLNNRVQVF